MSRVVSGLHFVSDVVTGCLLRIFLGYGSFLLIH